MKSWVFFLVILYCISVTSRAQNISVSALNDADSCYALGKSLLKNGAYVEARNYLNRGAQLAQGQIKSQCVYLLGMSYYLNGHILQIGSEYLLAANEYETARRLFKKVSYYPSLCDANIALGELKYSQFYEYERAYDLIDSAYLFSKEHHLEEREVRALVALLQLCNAAHWWRRKNEILVQLDSLALKMSTPSARTNLWVAMGDEARSNKKWDLARSYYEKVYAVPNSNASVNIHQKMRDLALDAGNYTEAVQYGDSCIEDFARDFPTDSPRRYWAYAMQANVYGEMGNREQTFRCMDSLFLSQLCDANHLEKCRQLVQRGQLHAKFKEYEDAIQDYNEVESILGQGSSESDLGLLSLTLALRGGAYFQSHQYEAARQDYLKYTHYQQQIYGTKSQQYVASLDYLANIEGYCHDYDRGSAHYKEAVRLMLSLARDNLKYLPSSSRETYWEEISSLVWRMSSFALGCGFDQNDFTESAYDALLYAKGLLLASERTLESMVRESGSTSLREGYAQLLELRNKFQTAEAKGDNETAENAYTRLLTLDKQLTQQLNAHGGLRSWTEVSYQDVRKALKEDDVLIDLTEYENEEHALRYVAYVVRRAWEYPKLVFLCKAEQIDSLLWSVNNIPDRLYQVKNAQRFFDTIGSPLCPFIGHGTTYFVPTGIFHQLAIESIPTDDGNTWGEKYNIIRLTSAKELIGRELNNHPIASAVLYGGLKYDLTTEEMVEQHQQYGVPNLYVSRSMNLYQGDSCFSDLPATLTEVTQIASVLQAHGIRVTTFMENLGTEESFINLSGKAPDILHLATHGFYYTSEQATQINALSGYHDMMRLTGLVLAGGNAEWLGRELPEGVLGGILTSEEISHLDLSNVKIAVLSACETGQGQAGNEGLFGLERAFKKAGAQTLVLSLWQVSDWVTKDFMIAFYQHLLATNWNKRDAFELAKKDIRNKYEEPYFWAGFIMVD